MPIIAGFLVSIFSAITGFFAKWLSKKLAIGLSAVAVFASLTGVLWAVIGAALSTITIALPSDSFLLMGLWIAVPDSAQVIIAATVSADTAVALYRWNVQNLKLLTYVT